MRNASMFSIVAIIVVIFVSGASSVQAGWFGPSNFDDCVLEKMKGQTPNMIGVARSACRSQFPEEILLKEGIHYKKGQLKSSWYDTSQDTITIRIDENKTDYKVTRVVIKPMKEPCDSPNLRVDDEVEAKSPMFGSKYVADVPDASVIKCAIIEIWGKKK
ncbi:MAG: hypothetical protein KJ687_09695 [Proteobacteria bacterium]|nr:hypothetical protein [Pseudomonadota bacterium]